MIKGALRFKPDPFDYALIDVASSDKAFRPSHIGLIINESFTGSALVVNTIDRLREGQEIRVQIGRMGPMEARVVWVKAIDENILKLGIHYSDKQEENGTEHTGSYYR